MCAHINHDLRSSLHPLFPRDFSQGLFGGYSSFTKRKAIQLTTRDEASSTKAGEGRNSLTPVHPSVQSLIHAINQHMPPAGKTEPYASSLQGADASRTRVLLPPWGGRLWGRGKGSEEPHKGENLEFLRWSWEIYASHVGTKGQAYWRILYNFRFLSSVATIYVFFFFFKI